MSIINELYTNYRLIKLKDKYRKMNVHNETNIVDFCDIKKINVGKYTYGKIRVLNDSENKLIIGNYCSISDNVTFIVGQEHNYKLISTYPMERIINNNKTFIKKSKGDIIVDDDVWIGDDVTILSGVHIGQGSIIGAKSLVNKDVPPYCIVAGIPAKEIKYRFDKKTIKKLKRLDYSKLDIIDVQNKSELFIKENIKINDIERLISDIDRK